MIICVDINVTPQNIENEKETLDEIRKRLQESLKGMKKAKLIKRFGDVGITFWRMY